MALSRSFRTSASCWTIGLILAAGFLRAADAAQEDHEGRDAWQHPEQVMDVLGVKAGSRVADVGCGRGHFSFRLARRVGPQGKVYAEDTDEKELNKIRQRAEIGRAHV